MLDDVYIYDDNNGINQFYCKSCKMGVKGIYKAKDISYCENCVPADIKSNFQKINQNRKTIK